MWLYSRVYSIYRGKLWNKSCTASAGMNRAKLLSHFFLSWKNVNQAWSMCGPVTRRAVIRQIK